MMKVTVKMTGSFVHSVGFSERTFDLAPGTTAGGLLDAVKIDRSIPMVVARSGGAITPDEELRDGDRIVIAPVYSGG